MTAVTPNFSCVTVKARKRCSDESVPVAPAAPGLANVATPPAAASAPARPNIRRRVNGVRRRPAMVEIHGVLREFGDRATILLRRRVGRRLAAPTRIGEGGSMHGAFASVITEAWGSLGERRFLFLTLLGFVCAFGSSASPPAHAESPCAVVAGQHRVRRWRAHAPPLLRDRADDGRRWPELRRGETDGPWYAIYAVLFGVGFGLAIDEYALWLRLDDVYWSRQGRSSIDAALIALGLIGFVLLAFVPTRIGDDSFGALGMAGAAATLHFALVLIAAAKHRLVHALIGIFIPGLPAYAALRLAKPRSIWAKRFYGGRRPDKRREPSTGSGPSA